MIRFIEFLDSYFPIFILFFGLYFALLDINSSYRIGDPFLKWYEQLVWWIGKKERENFYAKNDEKIKELNKDKTVSGFMLDPKTNEVLWVFRKIKENLNEIKEDEN